MTLRELHQYCVEKANQYPELANEIDTFYDLAVMEIEDGEPESHECELAMSDIEDLINNK
jgi:hypothetical protein